MSSTLRASATTLVVVAAAAASLTPVARALDPTNPPLPSLRGATACAAGAADCNACVADVEGKFRTAFGTPGLSWSTKPWSFDWDARYPPDDIRPTDDFASGVTHHIQGFIKTSTTNIAYAGTHDDDDGEQGVVFFIAQEADGHKALVAMHRTTSRHPSGMQAIGKYVLVADGNKLRLYDLTRITQPMPADHTRTMPRGFAAGGGLGVVKLEGGSHLLMAYAPGGTDDGTRRMRFYELAGGLVRGKVTLLDDDVYAQPATWSGDYQFAENISAVTECGTGNIYVISTEGDSSFNGDGYWLLSRVRGDAAGQIQLEPRSAKRMAQDDEECWLRGSGTVHVDARGVMRFYCHQRKNIHWFYESEDRWYFRVGTP